MLSRLYWAWLEFSTVLHVKPYALSPMKLKVVTRTVSAVISASFGITGDVKALPVNHNRVTGFALLVSSFKLLFNFSESLFLAS